MTKPKSPVADLSQDAAYNQSLAVTPKIGGVPPPKLTWRADLPDNRDHVYKLAATTLTLVDLRPYCSSVENQGSLGSCTGHAVSSAMEVVLKKQDRLVEISRLFIYYQARLLLGTVQQDSGAFLRDCIKASNKLGAPAETLWRYDVMMFRTNPNRLAYADALKRRVIGYQRCPAFADVRSAISNGSAVVAGFLVYSSFMTKAVAATGIMPYPDTKKEKILGGHAVCLVGFDDNKKHFIAKNSWGNSWGDRGYFYMPYDVIKNPAMSSDFWVITGMTS